MRVSDAIVRDFNAYRAWTRRDGWGAGFMSVPVGPEIRCAASALEAFAAQESRGVELPTREPHRLAEALSGKRQLNWQIAQWAEGVGDGVSGLVELQAEFPELPAWVWAAVRRQAEKRRAIVLQEINP